MKKKVLFVDDEPALLQGLRRSLREKRNEWDMYFVESGAAALDLLAQSEFDAVISDMRMPGMNGAELLTAVARDHPGLIRMILSGHSDEELIIKVADTAHQFLTKPCEASRIIGTLQRAFDLNAFLGNGKLLEFINGLKHIPSMPLTYQAIIDALKSPTASLHDIGNVIHDDPAMAAKVLQLVNSAFFGLGRRITDCREAATIIGLDTLKSLVLSVGIFSQYEQLAVKDRDFSADELLNESLLVAKLAERIALAEGMPKAMADDCFMAGILHDIGLLVLEQNLSEDYVLARKIAMENKLDLSAAEMEVFGANHSAIGAYIIGLWGLPNSVVEAVAFHHTPSESASDTFCPLAAVHAADVLLQSAGKICCENLTRHDTEFLDRFNINEKLSTWKNLLPAEGTA
jgi:HD-like signal output (HDOD) protein/CheY-like chemotaxis protein